MSNNIRSDSTVFIFFVSGRDLRGRLWVSGTENRRDKFGNLQLEPLLNTDPRNAKGFRYDLAQLAARRFASEGFVPPGYVTKFTLERSNSSDELSAIETAPTYQDDRRVPTPYRGLLAVPGRDVRDGECWYVRFPNQGIESIRGATPEEAVDKTFERNLQDKAEKHYPPVEEPTPAPPQTTTKKYQPGVRVRPGDLR
jgi:hypothetical protein